MDVQPKTFVLEGSDDLVLEGSDDLLLKGPTRSRVVLTPNPRSWRAGRGIC